MEVMGENVVLTSAAQRRGQKRQHESETKEKERCVLSLMISLSFSPSHKRKSMYCIPKENGTERKAGPVKVMKNSGCATRT